jgi:hypothetical protein
MAHPLDHQSIRDISKLKLSNRMASSYHGSHADTLVYNFLRENPNWAIDSLVSYLMATYSDYGISREIIASQIKMYIMTKD